MLLILIIMNHLGGMPVIVILTEPTGSHQHLGFQRGLAIASLNITGLCNHLDEIEFLLDGKGIHILALNETKLDGSIPKELTEISGYQQQRIDRTYNGGWVSLYVKDCQNDNQG